MNSALQQIQVLSDQIYSDMMLAAHGQISSQSWISHQISKLKLPKIGNTFQVILIGSSHIEIAIIKNEQNGVRIDSFKTFDLPTIYGPQEFSKLILKYYNPKIQNLSLILATHLKPVENNIDPNFQDAGFIRDSKFSNFRGLKNLQVGEFIKKEIREKLKKKINISVTNNVVALSGLVENRAKNWQETVAGVVATGFNFGFFESQNDFINLEAGDFVGAGESIDSIGIMEKTMEKQVFPLRHNSDLTSAEIIGIKGICERFNKKFPDSKIYSAGDFSKVLGENSKMQTPKIVEEPLRLHETKNPKIKDFDPLEGNPQSSANFDPLEGVMADAVFLKNLLHESAKRLTAHIAALHKFKKSQGVHSLKFLIAGDLFWEAKGYKETVQEFLKLLGIEDKIEFIFHSKPFIYGAAKLSCVFNLVFKKEVNIIQKLWIFKRGWTFSALAPPASL